ncbi:MAG: hybrid sensor histidine kinase/response regulator [Caldimonas sp.]
MTTASHGHATEPHHAQFLDRIYGYVGAHNSPLRYDYERDRAWHRTAMPAVSIVWIFMYHRWVGTPVTEAEIAWACGAFLYAIAGISFWVYLKRRPKGGIHVQYAFFALDPLIVGWALYAAPEPLAWWLVLLLVIFVKVGFRYGRNAMKVELVFCWAAALLPLLFSPYWHTQFHMAASLVLMLICAWWLFAPLNRLMEKATRLEVENARLQSEHDSLQAKGEFLSRVSHELRSPLQGIVSSLDTMKDRYCRDEGEAMTLARIRRGALAINGQLRDLLTIARGDMGKIELDPMPFEVKELATTIACEVLSEAKTKGISLEIDVPEKPAFLVADAGRIDQVLTNLLTNAIRHTQEGAVRLKLHPVGEDGRLRFEISDTGPGIEERKIPALFDAFTRFAVMDGNGDWDGAGLGLAVVHSVLKFLDGNVTVESELGKGTTFKVEIPTERLPDEPRSRESLAQRVLVVDDHEEALHGIASVVRKLGLDCDVAQSVATAANLLGARPYDLVFLDLDMPLKSGYDLAGETRRGNGPNKNARIVSISGAHVPKERHGAPFNGHLTKPIMMPAIQWAIALPLSVSAMSR